MILKNCAGKSSSAYTLGFSYLCNVVGSFSKLNMKNLKYKILTTQNKPYCNIINQYLWHKYNLSHDPAIFYLPVGRQKCFPQGAVEQRACKSNLIDFLLELHLPSHVFQQLYGGN